MTSRSSQLSYLAALVAIALLSFAGVRSDVMQASMGAQTPMPDCGMGRMHMEGSRKSAPAAPAKMCSYCAVAAHAPALTTVEPLLAPVAIAYMPWPPVASLGARGPPAFEARARGPPSLLFTA